ncbi:uncharacterized protein KGF55_000490 [Candida pseudojiufengensis]|uniref:uncharacterized protein n=1 Tax=Candida pseudojiufengensis TaxID=497109 RepID=UPI002225388E|nr:uncharacterized protein KGF55_000490 [Candida pseudojiufengensis]KAI5966181.1 hypothetical protein KGF55_000490 [Candida pseudojiufengensis]
MSSLVQESPEEILELLKKKLPIPSRLTSTAIELSNTSTDGYSSIYRNSYDPSKLYSKLHPSLTTLYEFFEFGYHFNSKNKALGIREVLNDGKFGDYIWQDYKTIRERRNNFGSGIFYVLENNPFGAKFNYDPFGNYKSFVLAIFSHNRPEWALTDLTCIAYSITNTALYDTLGADTSRYILALTEAPIVVCSKEKIKPLIELKRNHNLNNLIVIVSMDDLDNSNDLYKLAEKNKIKLYDQRTVEEFGKSKPLNPIPPTSETTFTISFTSGTTAAPKGVVLTHGNAVSGLCWRFSRTFGEPDIIMSFLPMAHIYERANAQFYLCNGASIGYPSGRTPLTLFDDVKVLKPTVLATVPRMLNKLESTIKSLTINNPDPKIRQTFTKAISEKLKLHSQPNIDDNNSPHIDYDPLLNSLREKIGMGSIKTMTTGSSPIDPRTIKFVKAALNVGISNGYGSTESFAGFLSSFKFDPEPGSIGPIGITTECRLTDIPSMNYTSKDIEGPRGELLLRGPQIFKEYYKDAKATSEAFDEFGWFHTGDVARIDSKKGNHIYIIDRVKNFFKLAQGEFVSPEKIENLYLSSNPLIQQIFIHGNSLESYLVGIIGLDPELIKEKFKINNLNQIEFLKFLNEPKNKKQILIELNSSIGDSLQGFEKLHNVEFNINPLTVEENLITPTFKIKRPNCIKFFENNLKKLYGEGSILRNEKL